MLRFAFATALIASSALLLMNSSADAACTNLRDCVVLRQYQPVNPPSPPDCPMCGRIRLGDTQINPVVNPSIGQTGPVILSR